MDLKIYGIIACLCSMVLTCPALAQEKNIERSNQQWLQYYNQTKLSRRWAILFDGGYRWKEKLAHRSQYIARLAVGFEAAEHLNFALGFAHLGNFQTDGINRLEYRPYQELSLKQSLGKNNLSHRFRIEERFFRKPGASAAGNSFNLRFRYRFSWNIPLFSWSQKHPERKLAANLADEVFLNAGKKVVYNVFDQNRLLLGLVWPVNAGFSLNLTFSSQFAGGNVPAKFNYTEVLWLGINHKIDLTQKVEKP